MGKAVERPGVPYSPAPGGPSHPQEAMRPHSVGLSQQDIQVERSARLAGLSSWQVSQSPGQALPQQQHQQQQRLGNPPRQPQYQHGGLAPGQPGMHHPGAYHPGSASHHAHLRAQQQQQQQQAAAQQQQRFELQQQQLLQLQRQQAAVQQQQQQQQLHMARAQLGISHPQAPEAHNPAALRAAQAVLQSQGAGWPGEHQSLYVGAA